jgi:catechol 2,3-dioxygenase-like lactoylglutathione lyase family enzyme
MKLAFVFLPVSDLARAIAFYRDTLGLDEAWREGDHTVAFSLPSTDVALMLGNEPDSAAGPLFLVDSVTDFYEQNRSALNFRFEPRDIPPGLYTIFDDPAGNVIRVMDVSKERGDGS